jgi:iron only hydrogenase large subunit-like protein
MQSHVEVLDFLTRNPDPLSLEHTIPVLSISPQSLASLAASVSPPPGPSVSLTRILARVRAFCNQKLKIQHVFDTTFARHIALREHLAEYRERTQAGNSKNQLPMLASACPGWVCYAEKAHPEMIPFMSQTKSAQQIMGTIVKNWIGAKCGKTYVTVSINSIIPLLISHLSRPDKMYHITVMPCYDKKLEASRSDFYNEQYSTRDVDCVLTTGELELMMREERWDIRSPVANEDTSPNKFGIPDLLQHKGSSSGSYLQYLIDSISKSIIPSPVLSTRRIRSDYEEYALTNSSTGEVVFKGARCYGFRNLQNIVRKVGKEHGLGSGRGAAAAGRMAGNRSNAGVGGPSLRVVARRRRAGAGATPETEANEDAAASKGYDYVEVMACPGGCVNGGGQLKPSSSSRFSLASPSQAIDEEGYVRNWEASGISQPSPATSSVHQEPDMSASERWGDKAWIKRVENAYWNSHGILTPPPSPPASIASLRPSITPVSAPVPTGGETSSPAGAASAKWEQQMNALSAADTLADMVVAELFNVAESRGTNKAELLRTEYRAVVSEVVGLAVKW